MTQKPILDPEDLDINIENVVASASLDQKINLLDIMKVFRNVDYMCENVKLEGIDVDRLGFEDLIGVMAEKVGSLDLAKIGLERVGRAATCFASISVSGLRLSIRGRRRGT